ncbi:hypothetical protein [uncultured Roseobacter sp.]|uniref:hypothetical protein n=1 Tax=uncultured Roseobacter sp. TaxID=114847 RepID=UPI00260DCF3C|nr:hypothetical protein [uncultured Roseobacter sp.]
MSKTGTGGFAKSGLEARPIASDHPVLVADWKDRLDEARAKRAKRLLKQGNARSISEPLPTWTDRDDDVPAAAEPTPDVERALPHLSTTHAVKALLVFSGAAGFGLGVTLGFGALIGIGVRTAPREAPAVAVTQSAKAEQQPVSPDPVVAVEVPAARAAAPVETAAVSTLTAAPVGFFAPEPGSSEAITLPEISAVQYLRADTDLVMAATLRSLPEVPGLTGEEAMYGSISPQLQFFMHAPDGIPNDRLQSYVAELEAAGIAVAEIGRERFRVSTTHLRYYSPETASVAQAVASDLGIEARDFSENALNSERIEVWVAGRPKPSGDVEQPRTGFFARLFNPQSQRSE